MKPDKPKKMAGKSSALAIGTLTVLALRGPAQAQIQEPPAHDDILMDTLIEKGILTTDDAKRIEAGIAARQTNALKNGYYAPPLTLPSPMKSMRLFGDARLRYEYRGVDNIIGANPTTF